MQRILGFIRTTAIGGLLVIVPIAVVLFILLQLFYGLYAVIDAFFDLPAVEKLGLGVSDAVALAGITVAALVGFCFLTGLVVQTRLGQAVKAWLARNVAPRIPMYTALSNLTKRVVGVEGTQFTPVEVDLYGSGTRAIGFLVEELPGDRCAVFIPAAPVATVGNIYVVPQSAVTTLGASVADTAAVLTQWGVDAQHLYAAPDASAPSPSGETAA